jgi:diacylglycerol kinase family enzyme
VRTCIIFNPTAKGEKAGHFRRHLGEIGSKSTLKQTARVEDARRLATEAVGEGFEIIVAAGGDGTLNEVLNGIADVPDGFARARLGVLPLGTVNVFARELGIPRKLEPAWQTILQARETLIDLPAIEYRQNGSTRRR